MCLVAIAWQVHPRYPLVLLGNRDEFHARPTAPADWWQDLPPRVPAVVGGRDLQAGGSWLGLSRSGRLAVVTNYPGRRAAGGAPSRGGLVRDFLTSRHDVEPFIDGLADTASRYAGFSLLVATPADAGLVVANEGPVHRGVLDPGIHVFSNSSRIAPWPKAGWLATRLGEMLDSRASLTVSECLDLLLHRGPVNAAGNPPGTDDGGGYLPAVARQPFVTGNEYGTRSSSAILLDSSGEYRFSERRFGPAGRPDGESHFAFPYQQLP